MEARQLAFALLVRLRAGGVDTVSARAFHAAFADLVGGPHDLPCDDPAPHPLFDVYPCVEDAYDEILRCCIASWVLPHCRELAFAVSPAAARKLAADDGVSDRLASAFRTLYKSR